MKKIRYARIGAEPVEFEELRPRVRYKELLKPETDWAEEISPSKVNGVHSDEHRDHG